MPRPRPRGDIVSLLETAKDTDTITECPQPEDTTQDYTVPRLRRSLTCADNCLQRKDLSPRSTLFLELFKDNVKETLEMEDKSQSREQVLGTVRLQEELIVKHDFLRPLTSPLSQEMADLQNVTLQLWKIEYFVRYGDLFKDLTNAVKQQAKFSKLDGWELVNGSRWWSHIASDLRDEDEAWRKFIASCTVGDIPSRPISRVICYACKDLHLD